MITMPTLQAILEGILHTEEKDKQTHEATENNKPCLDNK